MKQLSAMEVVDVLSTKVSTEFANELNVWYHRTVGASSKQVKLLRMDVAEYLDKARELDRKEYEAKRETVRAML